MVHVRETLLTAFHCVEHTFLVPALLRRTLFVLLAHLTLHLTVTFQQAFISIFHTDKVPALPRLTVKVTFARFAFVLRALLHNFHRPTHTVRALSSSAV